MKSINLKTVAIVSFAIFFAMSDNSFGQNNENLEVEGDLYLFDGNHIFLGRTLSKGKDRADFRFVDSVLPDDLNSRFLILFSDADYDGDNGGGGFLFRTKNENGQVNDALTIRKNGHVGIGTTNPGNYYRLNVNGPIRANEIVVDTDGADFVFEDDFDLLPLNELEQSIKQNRHLPGIPSAKEVEANGVSLGEMQTKLLQKIEELTLYVINLKKENEVLKERMATLETK